MSYCRLCSCRCLAPRTHTTLHAFFIRLFVPNSLQTLTTLLCVQESPYTSWNLQVTYLARNSPPPVDPLPSQINVTNTFICQSFKKASTLSSDLCLGLQVVSSDFRNKTKYALLACIDCSSLLHTIFYISWRFEIIKFLLMFSSATRSFPSSQSNEHLLDLYHLPSANFR
jgi:hypothetical protein